MPQAHQNIWRRSTISIYNQLTWNGSCWCWKKKVCSAQCEMVKGQVPFWNYSVLLTFSLQEMTKVKIWQKFQISYCKNNALKQDNSTVLKYHWRGFIWMVTLSDFIHGFHFRDTTIHYRGERVRLHVKVVYSAGTLLFGGGAYLKLLHYCWKHVMLVNTFAHHIWGWCYSREELFQVKLSTIKTE